MTKSRTSRVYPEGPCMSYGRVQTSCGRVQTSLPEGLPERHLVWQGADFPPTRVYLVGENLPKSFRVAGLQEGPFDFDDFQERVQ